VKMGSNFNYTRVFACLDCQASDLGAGGGEDNGREGVSREGKVGEQRSSRHLESQLERRLRRLESPAFLPSPAPPRNAYHTLGAAICCGSDRSLLWDWSAPGSMEMAWYC
jgi:hypothetical protein